VFPTGLPFAFLFLIMSASNVDDVDEGVCGVVVKVARGTRDIGPEQMLVRDKAFATIKSVFLRHGGAQIDTPVFELKEILMGKYGEEGGKLIYELDDQGGENLALRYDLTVPFARYLGCHKETGNMKRFQIGRVYRRDNPVVNRGRFREFYQCDFDIAGYDAAVPMLPDAECLKILVEILDELNIGEHLIKLNHRKLLDAVMQVAGVTEDMFQPVCSAIDKLDKQDWKSVRDELVNRKGIDSKAADLIGTYVAQSGTLNALLSKLQKDAVLAKNADALAAFHDLAALSAFLKAFDVPEQRVRFDLSLARGLDYYTGLIYEAVLAEKNVPSGSGLGSIAAGGRYDGLMGMFCGKQVPAVGLSIGVERILDLLVARSSSLKPLRRTATQVLVCSVGSGMLFPRLEIVNELWRAGIAAECSYSSNPKPKAQAADASEDQIPCTVWIGSSELKHNSITIKAMADRKSQTVSRNQLVSHILKILAPLAVESKSTLAASITGVTTSISTSTSTEATTSTSTEATVAELVKLQGVLRDLSIPSAIVKTDGVAKLEIVQTYETTVHTLKLTPKQTQHLVFIKPPQRPVQLD
jgi:histidyl-tRNA synthetase